MHTKFNKRKKLLNVDDDDNDSECVRIKPKVNDSNLVEDQEWDERVKEDVRKAQPIKKKKRKVVASAAASSEILDWDAVESEFDEIKHRPHKAQKIISTHKHVVRPGGHVRPLEEPDVENLEPAPIQSTDQNLNPSVNKREVRKINEDEKRAQTQLTVEEQHKLQLDRRKKGMANLSLQAIENNENVKGKGDEDNPMIDPSLVSSGLSLVSRATYSMGHKALNFYVLQIEQENTLVDRRGDNDRSVDVEYGKGDGDTSSESEEERLFEKEYADQDEEDADRAKRRKKWRKRQRQSDDDDDAEEDDKGENEEDTDHDSEGNDLSETENIEINIDGSARKTWRRERGAQIRRKQKRKRRGLASTWQPPEDQDKFNRYDFRKPVESAKKWFDLKQDKATVEATLRLTGRIEEKRFDPKTKTHTTINVPGVVYVHNFRSRFNSEIPQNVCERLGLRPRPDFEAGIHTQFVLPLSKTDPLPSDREDAKTTGILSATIRKDVREWITNYKIALEKEVAKAEAETNSAALGKKKWQKTTHAPYILTVRMVWKASSVGFQGNLLSPFLEIQVCLPTMVPQVRAIVSKGIIVPYGRRKPVEFVVDKILGIESATHTIGAIVQEYTPLPRDDEMVAMPVFECQIKYAEHRFPVDMQMAGDTWITLPAGKFSIRTAEERGTIGLRPDWQNPDLSVPSVVEIDTSYKTIDVHCQRAQPIKQDRILPYNHEQLKESVRGFSWQGTFEMQPGCVLPGPPPKSKPTPQNSARPPDERKNVESNRPPEEKKTHESRPLEEKKKEEHIKSEDAAKPDPWARIVDYPVVSFDIECLSDKGFPDAIRQDNPIVALSMVFGSMGQQKMPKGMEDCHSIVITTGQSSKFDNMPKAQIMRVKTEKDLLLRFAWIMRQTMPGICMSYNGDGFDWPYILDRTITLEIPLAQYVTGIVQPISIKTSSRETVGFGASIQNDVTCAGMNNIDIMRVVKKMEADKFQSYSLNSVAKYYVGKKKADVHHTDIPKLYRGTPDQVRRLLYYNIMDSFLVLQIFIKRKYQLNLPIMARISNIQTQQLFSMGPGSQSQVCQLMDALRYGVLKPYSEYIKSKEKYKGATVIVPKTGFYFTPIIVWDFASLYPSIMIAYNLCSTTYLTWEQIQKEKIPESEYHTIYSRPDGGPTYWAKPSLRAGIIPQQLQSYLASRKKAKKQKDAANDMNEKDVYDVIQKAIKIKANSVYGLSKQMMEAIAYTVTYVGRMLIEKVKETIETYIIPENGYTPERGYPQRPNVIYGDTDSVMADFGAITLPQAFEIGDEIAKVVKVLFPPAISLEFEKVYYPYLISKKKRYSGPMWTKETYNATGSYEKNDKKGSEVVRSDSCKLQKEAMTDVYDLLLLGRLGPTSSGLSMLKEIYDEERCKRRYGLSTMLKKQRTKTERQKQLDRVQNQMVNQRNDTGKPIDMLSRHKPLVLRKKLVSYQPNRVLIQQGQCTIAKSITDNRASVSAATQSDVSSGTNSTTQSVRKEKKKQVPENIIDFDSETFVDPFVRWSDPTSPDFTAPIPPCTPNYKELRGEDAEKFKRELPDRIKAVQPLTIEIARARVRIAIQLIRYRSQRLLAGKIDLFKLILSKSLRKKVYPTLNIASEVAKKMALRDPGSAPTTGDRVPFLFRNMPKDTKVAMKADDPLWILEKGLPIDFDHYLERQIIRPMSSLFIPVFKTIYPSRMEFQQQLYELDELEDGEDAQDFEDINDEDRMVEDMEEDDAMDDSETIQDDETVIRAIEEMRLVTPARPLRSNDDDDEHYDYIQKDKSSDDDVALMSRMQLDEPPSQKDKAPLPLRIPNVRKTNLAAPPSILPPSIEQWLRKPKGLLIVVLDRHQTDKIRTQWLNRLGFFRNNGFTRNNCLLDESEVVQMIKEDLTWSNFAHIAVVTNHPKEWKTLDMSTVVNITVAEISATVLDKVPVENRTPRPTARSRKGTVVTQSSSSGPRQFLYLTQAEVNGSDTYHFCIDMEDCIINTCNIGLVCTAIMYLPTRNKQKTYEIREVTYANSDDAVKPTTRLSQLTWSTLYAILCGENFRLHNMRFNMSTTRTTPGAHLQFGIESQVRLSTDKRMKKLTGVVTGNTTIENAFKKRAIMSTLTKAPPKNEGKKRLEPLAPLIIERLVRRAGSLQPTEAELKTVIKTLKKRTKEAIAASQALLFEGVRANKKAKIQSVEHNETTNKWMSLQKKSKATNDDELILNENGLMITRRDYNQRPKEQQPQALTRLNTCMLCKTVLHSEQDGVVCVDCSCDCGNANKGIACCCRKQRFIEWKQELRNAISTHHNKIWTGCIACAGTDAYAKGCSNNDCDVFYERRTTGVDIEELNQIIKRACPTVVTSAPIVISMSDD